MIKFVDEGKKCKGQEIAENSYGQISDPKLTKKKGVSEYFGYFLTIEDEE